MASKIKLLGTVFSYMSIIVLLTLLAQENIVRQYSFFNNYTIFNVRFPVLVYKRDFSAGYRDHLTTQPTEDLEVSQPNNVDKHSTRRQTTTKSMKSSLPPSKVSQDPACGVKYAVVIFEKGKDCSDNHLLLHKQQEDVAIFTTGSKLFLLHGVEEAVVRGDTQTVHDLLSSISKNSTEYWNKLEYVIYCRDATLLNIKNVLAMLKLRGK